jgi:hypothetical protein
MKRDPEARTTMYRGFRRLIRDQSTNDWVPDPAVRDHVTVLTVGTYNMGKEFNLVLYRGENLDMNRLRV